MKAIEIREFTAEGAPSLAYERVTQLGRDIMALAVRVPRPLPIEAHMRAPIVAVAAGEYISEVVLKDQNVLLNVEAIDLNLYPDSSTGDSRDRPRFRLVMNAMAGDIWHTEDDPVSPLSVGANSNRPEQVEEFELSGGIFEQELQKKYGKVDEQDSSAYPLELYYMLGEKLLNFEHLTPKERDEAISAIILSFYIRYGIDTLLKSQPKEDQFEYIHGIEDWMVVHDNEEDGEEDIDIEYEDSDAPDVNIDPGEREPDLLAPTGYVEEKEFDDEPRD